MSTNGMTPHYAAENGSAAADGGSAGAGRPGYSPPSLTPAGRGESIADTPCGSWPHAAVPGGEAPTGPLPSSAATIDAGGSVPHPAGRSPAEPPAGAVSSPTPYPADRMPEPLPAAASGMPPAPAAASGGLPHDPAAAAGTGASSGGLPPAAAELTGMPPHLDGAAVDPGFPPSAGDASPPHAADPCCRMPATAAAVIGSLPHDGPAPPLAAADVAAAGGPSRQAAAAANGMPPAAAAESGSIPARDAMDRRPPSAAADAPLAEPAHLPAVSAAVRGDMPAAAADCGGVTISLPGSAAMPADGPPPFTAARFGPSPAADSGSVPHLAAMSGNALAGAAGLLPQPAAGAQVAATVGVPIPAAAAVSGMNQEGPALEGALAPPMTGGLPQPAADVPRPPFVAAAALGPAAAVSGYPAMLPAAPMPQPAAGVPGDGVGEGRPAPAAAGEPAAPVDGGSGVGEGGDRSLGGAWPEGMASAPAATVLLGTARQEPSLSVAEAARQLSVPERTLRAWIAEGRVPAFRPDPTRRGMRLPFSALEIVRQRVAENSSVLYPGAAAGSPASLMPSAAAAAPSAASSPALAGGGAGAAEGLPHPAAVEVLQARLDGAQTAARLHAQRRQEEQERHREALVRREEELARTQQELAFLRERMVKAEEAERELRILLAQQTQACQQATHALQALTEKPALPPPSTDPRPRVRWWTPWRRGG